MHKNYQHEMHLGAIGWPKLWMLCLMVMLAMLCSIAMVPASAIALQTTNVPAKANSQNLEQDANLDSNPKLGPFRKSKPLASDSFDPAFQNDLNENVDLEKDLMDSLGINTESFEDPEKARSSLRFFLTVGALSLAPALILMTTSFVRIMVVLAMLRQALGAQQMPPTQVITALAIFVSLLVMAPVWNDIKSEAVDPYTHKKIDFETAVERGSIPLKKFMSRQIDMANNSDDVWLFYKYLPEEERKTQPETYDEVPLKVLLPAFLISELKIAFLIGIQVYLPFLIIDVVVSSVTVSMGMMMLPPTMISLPLKILLFVMVDGWTLIVGMLLESFASYT